MEAIPLDFTEYLSARFGLTPSATNELLASWLRTYEPEEVRREREARGPERLRHTSESSAPPTREPTFLAQTG
jgi:hypothetical protein